MSNADKHFYEFGPFRLDPAQRLLRQQGEIVPLQLKTFEMLLALLEKQGQVVSKEELMQRVWPDTFVEEINLTKNISVLRKTLAQGNDTDGGHSEYIVTIPRQGYRFVAEVRHLNENLHSPLPSAVPLPSEEPENKHTAHLNESSAHLAQRSKRPKLLTGAIISLLVLALVLGGYLLWGRFRTSNPLMVGKTTLVVLPFHTLNAPVDLQFLGLAIPDAINARLAHLRQLRLIATAAVLRYENQRLEPQQIGQALASDYLLSGVVFSAAQEARVNVELVRVKDGARVWGESYTLAQAALHSLPYSIAEQISTVLSLRLSEIERQRFYRRYTENAAAYDLYLRGRAYRTRGSKEALQAALAAFEGALKLDQNYALAYAGLANVSALMRHGFAREEEFKQWEERAREAAQQALRLDEDLAEAHEALAAYYRFTEFDWPQAIESARRALELNPNLEWAHYYRARAFYHLGLPELVEREAQAGSQLNPESRQEAFYVRGLAAFHQNRFAAAVALWEESRRLGSSSNRVPAEGYYYLGKREQAIEILQQQRASGPRQEQHRKALLASFLAAQGAREQARALLQEVATAPAMFHHAAYSAGAAYAQLGEHAQAQVWLERAVNTGFPCYPWYTQDPLLEPLHNNPAFQTFLAGLRKSWEATKARYEP